MVSFIDAHRGTHGVEPICSVLPIAPSTYYAHLVRRADPARLPDLFVACGKQDRLIRCNEDFVGRAAAAGVTLRSDFGPGEHSWDYWDARIQEVLAWLPLRRPERAG